MELNGGISKIKIMRKKSASPDSIGNSSEKDIKNIVIKRINSPQEPSAFVD